MANPKKIALITGANKGLGLEMGRQLGQAGVTVVLTARDPQKGEAAAGKLRGEGLDVRFLKLDVTRGEDRAAAASFLEAEFGRLDILINNAGISGDGPGVVSATTAGVIHQTFETNFFAPVALTQTLLPLIRKSTKRVGYLKYVEHTWLPGASRRPEEPDLQFQVALL